MNTTTTTTTTTTIADAPIISLAQFKRELRARIGEVYSMTNFKGKTSEVKFTMPPRRLSLVNTVCFAFDSHRNKGELSYSYFAKASQYEVHWSDTGFSVYDASWDSTSVYTKSIDTNSK